MSDLYLIAHVINAISLETASIELEVASKDHEGRWRTNDGAEVWPFWMQEINAEPEMPDDWINHLHQIAAKQIHKRAPEVSQGGLLNLLGLAPKVVEIKRRV